MATTAPPAPSPDTTDADRRLADDSAWAALGSFCFRRRWLVLIAWVGVLVVVFAAVGALGSSTDSSFESPDSDSQLGFDILEEHFDAGGSFIAGSIVFEAEQGVAAPEVQAALEELFAEVSANEEVTLASPYAGTVDAQALVAADGTIAYARIDFEEGTEELRASEIGQEIVDRVEEIDIAGLRIEVGGAALAEFEPPETEFIGLAFAVVILILAFGSVAAMGLPIGVAAAGVAIGVGLTTLLTHVISIPDFATTLGLMIGLGVGIDYALFIVTRYREGTKLGMSPHRATMVALDTAGRAVFFAGLTVVISLLGMYIIGLSFISGLATSAALTVAVTMLSALTLLPAMIGFIQYRIEITRWRGLIAAGFLSLMLLGVGLGQPSLSLLGLVGIIVTLLLSIFVRPMRRALPTRREKPLRETWSYRWSRWVQRRPWPIAIGVSTLLILITLPVLSMRLGFSDESTFSEDTTTRQAYDLLVEGFGAGSNGPLVLVSEVSGEADFAAGAESVAALNQTDGVAQAFGPQPSPDGGALQILVIPETGPQDAATTSLVRTIRTDVVPSTDGSGLD
ncbi:MAG: MMPL family transporter, partial [Ilumatobacteraceae bacterium]